MCNLLSLLRALALGLLFLAPSVSMADPAPFDLAGPTVEVQVTHDGVTRPIDQIPNLSPGDQLWIKADLPAAQSVRYLLVLAFLRGATNPPPQSWFHQSETWKDKAKNGLRVTVPQGAQQALLFLAPQTGGDLNTLVDTVRGRPGAFVRASQDLNQASLDHARVDTFLAAIQQNGQVDPDRLKAASSLLSRSLGLKVDSDCLQKPPTLRSTCILQGQDPLVLDDGHSTSLVQNLTSGDSANLIQGLASTPQADFGYYSPYVGVVMDIARIMDSFHTAQYQYIPTLVTANGDHLILALNTPPSFHPPLSVLVAALPAVAPSNPPLIRQVAPKAEYCAQTPDLVLPVDGAPLAFSTGYAHDLELIVRGKDTDRVVARLRFDPARGGLVADTKMIDTADTGNSIQAQVEGYWGFVRFDGPHFLLERARATPWALDADDQQSLIVGRDDALHFRSPAAVCVESIMLRQPSGELEKLNWTRASPDELTVTASLKQTSPGPVTLLIRQYGVAAADVVALRAFAQPAHLNAFVLHGGDTAGLLTGSRLDEVANLTFHGVTFTPGGLTTISGEDELSMKAADLQAAKLKSGDTATAKVALRDGRTLALKVVVGSNRPSVTLVSKSVQASSGGLGQVQLADKNAAPQGATLTFSIRAQTPPSFTGREEVEIAGSDGEVLTTLTFANGLIREDSHVALATLDTAKVLGDSTFGALQYRIVDHGVVGDWQALATLVRLPTIRDYKCAVATDQPCELEGSRLFLIGELSGDPDFDHAIKVPEGFTGDVLSAPQITDGRLYVKLRDDPETVDLVILPGHGDATAPPASHPHPPTVTAMQTNQGLLATTVQPAATILNQSAAGKAGMVGPGKPAPTPDSIATAQQ